MTRFATIGERFGDPVTLDTSTIAAVAKALGDLNPLHHDATAAAQSRYGRIVASGPHTAGLFMGQTATFLSQRGEVVGLGFEIKFAGPAFADEKIFVDWTVVDVQWNEKHQGEIVSVVGIANHAAEKPILKGTGKLLVTSRK
jgi:3-hydroxybutyryl-CoA dehydratase